MYRLAQWVLKLYPQTWRARYGEELLAVLEQHRLTIWTLVDLLWSAGAAHFEVLGGMSMDAMLTRMRWGISAVFCAFVAFGVAYLPIMRVPDPMPNYLAAVQIHPEVRLWFQATTLFGELACLAIVAGGLPVLFTVLKQAISAKDRRVLRPFGMAVICLVVFLAATALVALEHIINGAVVLGYLLLFVVLLVTGTYSIARTVMRGNPPRRVLRFALASGAVAGACMLLTNLSALILTTLMHTRVPELSATQDTNVLMLVISNLIMLAAELVAAVGLVKGFRGTSAEGTMTP